MEVRQITSKETDPFLLHIHYAKRKPCIQYAYGLFDNEELIGCVTFGPPASPQVYKSLLLWSDKFKSILIELNRLCLRYNRPNEASFLVGAALRMLPKPKMVISYADSTQKHVGYIYQATNFMYCGSSGAKDYAFIIDGKRIPRRTICAQGHTNPTTWARENNIEMVREDIKHRYVYLCGDKRQKKAMIQLLKPKQLPYPKGEESK